METPEYTRKRKKRRKKTGGMEEKGKGERNGKRQALTSFLLKEAAVLTKYRAVHILDPTLPSRLHKQSSHMPRPGTRT
jgi:hypothetical protein